MPTTIYGEITNVADRPVGSPLDVAASATDTTITVVDIEEFDLDDGGSLQIGPTDLEPTEEIFSYTVPDPEANVIDLGAALTVDHEEETPVTIYPAQIQRTAYILTPDQEEELEVVVPLALWDRIPTGTRDPDDDSAEYVECDLIDGELFLRNIIDRIPLTDGTYIDPDTIPPATEVATDGDPPTASPTPTLQAGLGSLFITWAGISNHDPIDYEVHVSTSSGFTPDSSTLYAKTKGTICVIRSDPATGEALLYEEPDGDPEVYYVKLVATDDDGSASASSEVSGTPLQVSGDDIAVDSVAANHILTGSITAEKLATTLILASLIKTAEGDGTRVEMDNDGIRLYDSLGQAVVNLPTTAGAVASFSGDVLASSLTLLDYLSMRGSNNVIDGGGILTVSSKVAAPVTAPTITWQNDQTTLASGPDNGTYVNSHGFHYDSNGYGSQPTFLTIDYINDNCFEIFEHKASDGSYLRSSVVLGSFGPVFGFHQLNQPLGITRRGNIIYVMYSIYASDQVWVGRIRQSDMAFLNDAQVFNTAGEGKQMCIGTDGTYVLVVGYDAQDGTDLPVIQRYSDDNTTGGAWALNDFKTLTGLNMDGRADGTVMTSICTVSGKYWICHDKSGVYGASSWDTTTLAWEDETGFISKPFGVTHDGTQFWSRQQKVAHKHTNWTYASTQNYLNIAYTWVNTPATPDSETTASPQSQLHVRPDGAAHRKYQRQRLKISLPTKPSGVDSFHIYHAHVGAGQTANSNLKLDAATTYITTDTTSPTFMKDENASGANPPTTNNFPGAVSKIKSEQAVGGTTRGWELQGDGDSTFMKLLAVDDCIVKQGSATAAVPDATTTSFTDDVTHGMGAAPDYIFFQLTGSNMALFRTVSKDQGGTQTVFRVSINHRDAGSNLPYPANITYDWFAIAFP